MQITETPILGVTGALGTSMGVQTTNSLPTTLPSTGPIYFKSVKVTTSQNPGDTILPMEDIIGGDAVFDLPVPFSLIHCTHAEFSIEKLYLIMEPIKLSGSEVRLTVRTVSGPSGHLHLDPSLSNYSMKEEIVINEGGKLYYVPLPMWEGGFRFRNFPTSGASGLLTPTPISKFGIELKTKYQITPLHPVEFNVNLYILPIIKYAIPTLPLNLRPTLFGTASPFAGLPSITASPLLRSS
jgi:hypothetical protein